MRRRKPETPKGIIILFSKAHNTLKSFISHKMASVMAWGAGVAVAAFLVRSLTPAKSFQQLFRISKRLRSAFLIPRMPIYDHEEYQRKLTFICQGRAGFVALRRSRGGVGAMGKAFYKGGFEPRMTKKEASLILSLKYA